MDLTKVVVARNFVVAEVGQTVRTRRDLLVTLDEGCYLVTSGTIGRAAGGDGAWYVFPAANLGSVSISLQSVLNHPGWFEPVCEGDRQARL